MTNLTSKLAETLYEQALRQLTELKEQMLDIIDTDKQNIEIVIRREEFIDAVDYSVKKYNIDLVIMATKGATRARKIFFGSNTVHTIKAIKSCPVLIVPDEFTFEIPKEIAFPTDYSRFYAHDELRSIRDIGMRFDSTIRVLHIPTWNFWFKAYFLYYGLIKNGLKQAMPIP